MLIEFNNMYENYSYSVEITRTKDLIKLVTETFPEEIRFTHALGLHGSRMILHASDIHPTDSTLTSLVGVGLRDAEITVIFT